MASPIYTPPPSAPAAPSAPEPSSPETKEPVENATAGAVATEGVQPEALEQDDSVLEAAQAAKAKQQQEPKQEQPKQPEAEKKPEPPKRYKIKVDGSEEELDEDTIVKLAQLGRASNKRFQEAANLRKQAEEFINLLKQDPRRVLSNPAIGVDPYKLAEDWLIERMEMEKLTPEQQQLRAYEQQLKAYEEEKKQVAEQKAQEEQQKLIQHHTQMYEQQVTEALSASGLPKTTKTVKRMAEYMYKALENGIDLKPSDVVSLVKQDYIKEITDLFSQTDGDSLLQILSTTGIDNKIRKADLARLKSGAPVQKQQPTQQSQQAEQPRDPQTKRFLSTHEWREWQAKSRNS